MRSGSSNRQYLERELRKEATRGPDTKKGKTPSQAHTYSLSTLKAEVGGLAYKGPVCSAQQAEAQPGLHGKTQP